MKRLLALAIAITILGCSDLQPKAEVVAAPPVTSAPSAPAKPEAAAPSAPVAAAPSAPVAAAPKAAQASADARTGTDPNRINQLKDLKKVDLHALGHTIHCWIMDNESKRQEGMMFLKDKDVRSNEGMIFVFPAIQRDDGQHGFWMHNCPLGLDIVYIRQNKTVIRIADGKPYDETSLPPGGDYDYVLEMKTNCAKKLGIKKGSPISIPASLTTAE